VLSLPSFQSSKMAMPRLQLPLPSLLLAHAVRATLPSHQVCSRWCHRYHCADFDWTKQLLDDFDVARGVDLLALAFASKAGRNIDGQGDARIFFPHKQGPL
jgi:hypothetical protein